MNTFDNPFCLLDTEAFRLVDFGQEPVSLVVAAHVLGASSDGGVVVLGLKEIELKQLRTHNLIRKRVHPLRAHPKQRRINLLLRVERRRLHINLILVLLQTLDRTRDIQRAVIRYVEPVHHNAEKHLFELVGPALYLLGERRAHVNRDVAVLRSLLQTAQINSIRQ